MNEALFTGMSISSQMIGGRPGAPAISDYYMREHMNVEELLYPAVRVLLAFRVVLALLVDLKHALMTFVAE